MTTQATTDQRDLAKTAKFKFEFMLLMLMAGRNEHAEQAYKDGIEALATIIADGEAA